MAHFIAVLYKDKNSDFGVVFPDFPGCVTAGKTLDQAREHAAEALALHIAGMLEDGEDIPEPSTLDDLEARNALDGGVGFAVPYDRPVETVRFNVTAKSDDLAAIDRFAASEGMTRSGFITRAAMSYIDRNPGAALTRARNTGGGSMVPRKGSGGSKRAAESMTNKQIKGLGSSVLFQDEHKDKRK